HLLSELTILGLRENLTQTIGCLEEADSSVAVSSGGKLFLRFISLTSLEHPDLSQCKKAMVERGELFLKKISLSRSKVAKLCHTFIKDGAKILTHSSSRVVLRVLASAAADKKRFIVYVTESQPDCKIGTYQLTVFTFVRLFPLNQQDVPDRFKYKANTLKAVEDLAQEHPMIDYTLPLPITLLFTDLGVYTRSAVSDELIKLYL
uniref:Translation initiation factor eIF2B subunit alpha n=1 Tax=Oncorhynchus mykiss TaxID=8022 RepID=A0A8C7M500_ONCMY